MRFGASNMTYVGQRGQTCLIAALAMVWDIKFEEVVKMIGHTGVPQGIHNQEVVDAILKQGMAMVIIEAHPAIVDPLTKKIESMWTENQRDRRFEEYLKNRKAVLIGVNKQGAPHAVAYDGEDVFDPASSVRYPLEDFTIKEAWLFFHIL